MFIPLDQLFFNIFTELVVTTKVFNAVITTYLQSTALTALCQGNVTCLVQFKILNAM